MQIALGATFCNPLAARLVFKYFKSMSTVGSGINFSELSNKPVDSVRKLHESPNQTLLLHRRGGEEDLVLTTASRAEEVREVVSTTTTLFIALMQHHAEVRELVTDVMPKVFPWVRFLPREDMQAFVVELVETLEAANSLGTPAPVSQLIGQWRRTAEVHADPRLVAILNRDDDEDFGEVPAPGVTTA
ncbi:hypothetical protein SK571_22075 [Lentzea sp. BCCO 10_0798]|uniref:Uncharacterized protein n=1 Tax=Lentzea kristufekii TaxID=3095430 RepID=A0ABU4TUX8_9PSEU|nr:hypothetical protein [Lentzea sp. BCCO 10_0798]MDX8052085.1 hypothetical protein [Lentzea sp. BCCO 10_0798]